MMRLRCGTLLLALLLLAAPAGAATFAPSITQSTLSVTSATSTTPVSALGAVGVDLRGSWGGTITFQCSVDGTNWFSANAAAVATGALVTTTTANGTWVLSTAGYQQCRVLLNPAISGTVTTTLVASPFAPYPLGTAGSLITGSVLQGTSPWTISGDVYVFGTPTITGTVLAGTNPLPVNQGTSPWVISGNTYVQGTATITGTVQVGNSPTVQPGNTANTTPWLITGATTAGTANASVNVNQVAGAATANSNPLFIKERQATTGGLQADVAITTAAYQLITANTSRISATCTNNDITSGVRVGFGQTPTSTVGFLLRAGVSFTTTGTFAISFIRDTGATNNVTVSCSTELQ